MRSAALSCLLHLALAAADGGVILRQLPGKQLGPPLALVIIQGASSPSLGYKPVAAAIQNASSLPVWIAIPEFILDTPEPLQYASKLQEALQSLERAGMPANHKTVVFAHSLGGVFAQQHAFDTGGAGLDALVLYGATELRKYRDAPLASPLLTLDGDLDGLLRVSRQAEAWWHSSHRSNSSSRPMVLLEGLNHWSVSSGPPPPNVRANDLPADVSAPAGHAAIATALADFLSARFDQRKAQRAEAAARMVAAEEATAELVSPIIDALRLEGSRRLRPPCESDYPTNPTCRYPKWPDKSLLPRKPPPSPLPPPDCTCGSEWVVRTAQPMMAGFDHSPAAATAVMQTRDAFHDVSDVRPFHLPHVFQPPPGEACSNTTAAQCVINSTTVTMPIFDPADAFDTGFAPLSARELRSKLKSRQSLWQKAGVAGVDFEVTDRNNTRACADINSAAYQWALQRASLAARARFQRAGTPLAFDDDVWSGIGITGPKWIHAPLRFTSNGSAVLVAAPTFATPNRNLGDEPFLLTVGYHCAETASKRLAKLQHMLFLLSNALLSS